MSRLASQKKLQYYPTPQSLLPLILKRIHLDPSELAAFPIVSILDPCAGEGWVLSQLRQWAGQYARTYAVEMGTERAAKVRALNFTQAIEADTVREARFPKHGYDLLWFNPPYDYDAEAKRLEQAFFNRVIEKDRALVPGGVFIGLLPKSAMKTVWSSLRDFLQDIHIYRFPDPMYQQFHQFVIYGVMRQTKRRVDDPSHFQDDALFKAVEEEHVPTLEARDEDEVHFTVSTRLKEPDPIHSLVFDPSLGYRMAAEHGWLTHKSVQDIFWPEPQPSVRTLLSLRPTFIGVMLASGLFNGLPVTLRDGSVVLLKGRTTKKQVYSSTKERVTKKGDNIKLDTYIDQFRPEIFMLYLKSMISTIQPGQLVLYQLPQPKKDESPKS